MKNIKYIGIIPIFTLSMISPSFSDTLSNNSQCDNATLHTTTGPATLNARWTANTIILNWNAGNDATFTAPAQNDAAYSCEYDGGITLPTQPTRSGYTFGGWAVRALFDMGTLENISPSGTWKSRSVPTAADNNGDPICREGKTEESCDLGKYAHLGNGEWSVDFTGTGTLKGESLCSSTNGTYATTGTPNETGGGQYCWCRASSFAETGSSEYQSVSSPSWVFHNNGGFDTADDCANYCAVNCAQYVHADSAFRRAIFGVTQ